MEKQAEPVYGWKQMMFQYHRPYWSFVSQYNGSRIQPVRAVAECARGGHSNKPPPGELCACGFYAYDTHTDVASMDMWLCKVRLYGKVIRYTKGSRAEKQDIVETWAPENAKYTPHVEAAIREQFPSVVFHFNDPEPEPAAQPQLVHITVSNPGNDVLPKEFVDSLNPGATYSSMMPLSKNASMTPMLTVTVTNTGLRFEVRDPFGTRILYHHFEGTKEWYTNSKP